MKTNVIIISGKSYYGACDPKASGVPVEENWPKPEQKKVGNGYRFIYPNEPGLAEKIASHLETLAAGFLSMDSDPETKAEGRAFARDAARIRREVLPTRLN